MDKKLLDKIKRNADAGDHNSKVMYAILMKYTPEERLARSVAAVEAWKQRTEK